MSSSSSAFQLPPDEDHKHALQAVWWAEFSIATVFICLCFLAEAVTINYVAETGRTRHLLYIAEAGGFPAVDSAVMWYIIVLDIGIFVTGFGKIAIGLTILRVLGTTSQWQRWTIYVTLFLTVATCIIDFCISTFRCGNPSNTWTIESWQTATCVSVDTQTDINIFANSVQCFADFAFSVLPMAVVWQLRLPMRKKLFLVIALGLTLVTGTAAIIKTVFAATMDQADITYTIFPSLVWFSTESMLIIVCGSVPSLYPLYERHVKRLRQGYSSQKTSKASRTYVYSGGREASHASSKKRLAPTAAAAAADWSLATLDNWEDTERGQPNLEMARLAGGLVQQPVMIASAHVAKPQLQGMQDAQGIQIVQEVRVSSRER
ncbi:f83a484d-4ce8-4a79-94e2-7a970524df2e [Thermothielavioides terrestris]|uniref:F83a484d-4ce8-4a79-94e2-7a970524df2e n=2 Tax=Thermothielavioides terrestris TaxID=2587410 RepID=A0A3S4B905_9PEZI|nr:f83a484d-4ce8-4a79-94e2-7a970524df2e [Thermothielavioides terrestris]